MARNAGLPSSARRIWTNWPGVTYPRASSASTRIWMLRRPPSFAAGSLLTILATPHSKSFQPAVVSTWLRRRRSVATRARGARARRRSRDDPPRRWNRASPNDAPRRGSRSRACRRRRACSRAREKRVHETRVRARARVSAGDPRRSPPYIIIIRTAGRLRCPACRRASSPRRISVFHTRRVAKPHLAANLATNLRCSAAASFTPSPPRTTQSALLLHFFPFSVDPKTSPDGRSFLPRHPDPTSPRAVSPAAPAVAGVSSPARPVPGTPPRVPSPPTRPRPPRAGNPPSPRTFPWTASD